jgi:hypothetical protein
MSTNFTTILQTIFLHIFAELSYKAETQVQCTVEGGGADPIRIFVCNSQSTVPILTAIINMPIAESFFSLNER